jgi:peptidoglycan/LPS O-acetylase OafA/YrhL
MEKSKVYFPNLDGIRFLCFLSVFLFHSFHTDYPYILESEVYGLVKRGIFGNGNLGVNFFFVLSGFLITYLLIKEKEATGTINIRNFYIRRILRIWPLFFLCVFFGFYIFPLLKSHFNQQPNETANIIYYLTFTNNFDFIKSGPPDASVLGALWSIAIEEQFYLVWPILLYIVPLRYYSYLFLSILFFTLFFRALNDSQIMHQYHTLSCIGDMAIGAWGAFIVQSIKWKNYFININRIQIIVLYSLFVFIFFFRDDFFYSHYFVRIIERSLIAFVILFIILEQNYSKNSFFKLSSFKNISKLGVISYGLYCLHFIGILITTTIFSKLKLNTTIGNVLFFETSVALAITILISIISYRIIEKPFLKFKTKYVIVGKEEEDATSSPSSSLQQKLF